MLKNLMYVTIYVSDPTAPWPSTPTRSAWRCVPTTQLLGGAS